ncbi:MAG: hypothetical protein LC104_16640 [Bacteroidales bacterium]|nr:hypothetical protein [Bacteroidales bacterium]
MKLRFLAASVLVLSIIAPALAQTSAGKPLVTAQTQPLGKILDDVKSIVRLIDGEKAVQKFNEGIREALGEKGFTGLDLNRRIVGYGDLNSEEPEKSSGFVVIPVTSAAEFQDLLARMSQDDEKGVTLTPVDGNPGLYSVKSKNDDDNEVSVRLRFHDRAAYFGFNVADGDMAAKKLLPAAAMIRPTDNSVFSYETHFNRYPAGTKKQALGELQKLSAMADGLPLPPGAKKAIGELLSMSKRMTTTLMDDGDVAAYRLRYDPQTTEIAWETAIIPRAGTKLAATIAARKPTMNRFAGLIGKETTGGLLLQLPLFAPEIRNAVEAGLDQGVQLLGESIPEEFQPLVEEARAGLVRTVQTGQFDIVAAVDGPDAKYHFGVALAVAFEDATKLEKQLNNLYEKFKGDRPELLFLKLDVAKVAGVNIHEAPLGAFLPDDGKAIFGKNSSAYIAFGPHGIYLTFGPKALDTIKAAVQLQPAPAKAFDLVMNPARLQKLIIASDPDGEAQAAVDALEKRDELFSVLFAAVEGGAELRVRFGVSVKMFSKPLVKLGESGNAESPGIKE